jgi:hypothetical protein
VHNGTVMQLLAWGSMEAQAKHYMKGK